MTWTCRDSAGHGRYCGIAQAATSSALVDWLAGVRDNGLFLSVVSIGEIERGNVRHFATSGVEVINPFGD